MSKQLVLCIVVRLLNMMPTDVASIQERIDMLKLAKIVASKSTQIIVQSRDGNKLLTKCNPNVSGHNTFNIVIREIVEVDKEVKRILGVAPSDRWSPISIEIYLKTVDGNYMSLEMWTMSLVADNSDVSRSYTLYSRLGILLKSLLAITRAIPGYRFSRRQSPDSYFIGHKIYHGEPQLNLLGEKYKQLKIGSVGMPIGKFTISVAYRTVMLISPQPSGIETAVVLKSDHFKPEFGPRNSPATEYSSSLGSDSSSYKVCAFVEPDRRLVSPTNEQLLPDVPFGSLLSSKMKQSVSARSSPPFIENEKVQKPEKVEEVVKEGRTTLNTPPYTKTADEDFLVVDLVKPPFAEPTYNVELGVFYQEWQAAPPLQACPNDPPVIEQVGDLSSQLACYESSVKEFDSLVTTLCVDPESNGEDTS